MKPFDGRVCGRPLCLETRREGCGHRLGFAPEELDLHVAEAQAGSAGVRHVAGDRIQVFASDEPPSAPPPVGVRRGGLIPPEPCRARAPVLFAAIVV